MTKYKIGDKLWWARFETHQSKYIECPDCGGTGRLLVTFHDGETVSIDCRNCSKGFDPPTGRIHIYTTGPDVRQVVITGMEVDRDEVKYKSTSGSNSYWNHDEEDLFLNKEEAESKAAEKGKEYEERENKRFYEKHKDTRSWAWNATYHRQQIKRAKSDIEYHAKKLNAANLKARKK